MTLQDDAQEDRRSATATVSVTISDGDDQGPAFVYQSCYRYNGICIDPQYTATVRSGAVVSAVFRGLIVSIT